MTDKPVQVSGVKNSVVVVGSVEGSIYNQSLVNAESNLKQEDIAKLREELSLLRQNMSREAKTSDESIAAGEVAKAEKSLEEKDIQNALKHLKSAGTWALDVAQKIGVPVAIEFIKRALAM